MNATHALSVCAVGVAALCLVSTTTPAGDLEPPPGPVTPTVKTLDQVEPRIVITDLPGDSNSLYKITAPGSYYLTEDVTGRAARHGIEIASNDVTIDLMGFTLRGVLGSLDGINLSISDAQGIHIKNGIIRDWGDRGIELNLGDSRVGSIRNITALGNATDGIFIRSDYIVSDCVARLNGGRGIGVINECTLTRCLAMENGDYGIVSDGRCVFEACVTSENGTDGLLASSVSVLRDCVSYLNGESGFRLLGKATIENCTASENVLHGFDGSGSGSAITLSGCSAVDNVEHGFILQIDCTFLNCTARSNGLRGISTGSNAVVRGCTASFNVEGIYLGSDCLVTDCSAMSNTSGIFTSNSDSRIDGNVVSGNAQGVDIDNVGNIIIRNSAAGNTTNYDIITGNSYGPIVNVAGVGDISSVPNADHPWANFEY